MLGDAASAELAASLLATAGLGSLAALESFGSSSNALYAVTDSRGGQCVLRRYKQNAPPHTALARLRRECWVYDVLERAGVPVPHVLATSEEPNAEAMLTTHIEGDHLGSVIPSLTPAEAAAAWSSCGRALAAVHAVDADQAAAAGCEQVGVTSPAASRGPYHHDQAIEHLDRLSGARPDLGPLGELRAAVDDALPLYERAPLVLCQYDAHLWQFLVHAGDGGDWACTAILDWEHADLDDPDWDVAQLDGFRWGDVHLVPAAFFAGYGRVPSSPLYTLYRLERAAWILAEHAGGARWLDSSVPLAERLLTGLLAAPQGLQTRVAAALAES